MRKYPVLKIQVSNNHKFSLIFLMTFLGKHLPTQKRLKTTPIIKYIGFPVPMQMWCIFKIQNIFDESFSVLLREISKILEKYLPTQKSLVLQPWLSRLDFQFLCKCDAFLKSNTSFPFGVNESVETWRTLSPRLEMGIIRICKTYCKTCIALLL